MSKHECELATCPIEDCEAAKCMSRIDCSARAYAEGVKAGRTSAIEGAVECWVVLKDGIVWKSEDDGLPYVMLHQADADSYASNDWCRNGQYEVRSARLIVGEKT